MRTRALCHAREPLPDKGNGSLFLKRHGAFMGLFQMSESDAVICFDILDDLLVIVVGH